MQFVSKLSFTAPAVFAFLDAMFTTGGMTVAVSCALGTLAVALDVDVWTGFFAGTAFGVVGYTAAIVGDALRIPFVNYADAVKFPPTVNESVARLFGVAGGQLVAAALCSGLYLWLGVP